MNLRPAGKGAGVNRITAATDGSSLGNPGPSGWAWVTADGSQDWASAKRSTNNRMELTAVLELLRSYPRQPLLVQSDSQYVIDVFTKWLQGWRDRGMQTAKRRKVKNLDLIEEISRLLDEADVEWEWVRGHHGHPLNKRADELARFAARRSKVLEQTGDLPSASGNPPRLRRYLGKRQGTGKPGQPNGGMGRGEIEARSPGWAGSDTPGGPKPDPQGRKRPRYRERKHPSEYRRVTIGQPPRPERRIPGGGQCPACDVVYGSDGRCGCS